MRKISVIVPCYNVEPYLNRLFDSLEAQTFGIDNLEIICLDDKSTDNTLKKLEDWEKNHSDNVCIVALPDNGGKGELVILVCSMPLVNGLHLSMRMTGLRRIIFNSYMREQNKESMMWSHVIWEEIPRQNLFTLRTELQNCKEESGKSKERQNVKTPIIPRR
jgi:cellulose synthase/poly-beta-1,6-N-acetylglucosamine synthase-like glycosyltransferase